MVTVRLGWSWLALGGEADEPADIPVDFGATRTSGFRNVGPYEESAAWREDCIHLRVKVCCLCG